MGDGRTHSWAMRPRASVSAIRPPVRLTLAHSADYMQGTRMTFSSKEDAMRFCDRQGARQCVLPARPRLTRIAGWDYYVQGEGVQRIPPKNYAENYVYKPHTLRIARTK